jgi:RimJ/RimL family protein N-acetyltransferase
VSTPTATRRTGGGRVVAPLHDRGCAVLRPLRHGEADSMLEVFERMSVESRASRYFTGMPRLTPSMLAALVDVDGCDHAAWVASVDGLPAGVAHYIRIGPQTAEIAFEVVDAHQGRGLGTVLADTITTAATANGVRRMRATVLPTNAASVALLARFDLPLTLVDGVLEGEGPLRLLDPPRVDRDAVVAVAAGIDVRPAGPCVPCPAA